MVNFPNGPSHGVFLISCPVLRMPPSPSVIVAYFAETLSFPALCVGMLWQCPFCPFRLFDGPDLVDAHVDRYHTAKNSYVPSGTQQIAVVVALHDNDVVTSGSTKGNYLFRSAQIMRRHARSVQSNKNRLEYGVIKRAYYADGVRYVSKDNINTNLHLRKVSTQTYASKCFYLLVFQEFVLCKGAVRTVMDRVRTALSRAGCELVSLLPTDIGWWLKVAEDITTSAQFVSMEDRFLAKLKTVRDLRFTAVDTTVKITMSLKGQSNYRMSKLVRMDVAVPEHEAVYRVFTMRTLTGAPRIVTPIRSESSEEYVNVITRECEQRELDQFEIVSVDNASDKLEEELMRVCVHLRGLIQDQEHLAMKYRSTQWGNVTPGWRVLKVIVGKFNKYDPHLNIADDVVFHTRRSTVDVSTYEKRRRTLIRDGKMNTSEARTLLESIEPDQPWTDRIGFVESLAALTSVFKQEVSKKDTQGNALSTVLYNAADPANVERMLNQMRLVHMVNSRDRTFLASATTTNEALHAELNVTWFYNQRAMYQPTLVLKLKFFRFAKLWSHHIALFRPTTRTFTQSELMSRAVVTKALWSTAEWRAWCVNQQSDLNTIPLAKQRSEHMRKVRTHKTTPRGNTNPRGNATTRKVKVHMMKAKRRKKVTAFTVKRVGSLRGKARSKH